MLVLTIEWSYYVHGTNTITVSPFERLAGHCCLRKFAVFVKIVRKNVHITAWKKCGVLLLEGSVQIVTTAS